MTSVFDAGQLFGAAQQPSQSTSTSFPSQPQAAMEARKEARVSVKWQARVLQPNGSVVPVRVLDISQSGLGLVGDHPIRAHAVLRIAIAVPNPNSPATCATVTGRFKTTHVTVSGAELLYGGIWISLDGDGNELLRRRIRELR